MTGRPRRTAYSWSRQAAVIAPSSACGQSITSGRSGPIDAPQGLADVDQLAVRAAALDRPEQTARTRAASGHNPTGRHAYP